MKKKGYIDVAIIGAGAAGMMCAARAAAQGLDVHLFDHASKLAEKIRISGGGRCNFTNRGATWENYVSQNPRFARYALMTYTPEDFLALLRQYDVAWHEKHRGQLFCDDSSQEIIRVLEAECRQAGVHWHMPCTVEEVSLLSDGFNRAGGISDLGVAVVMAKKDTVKNDDGSTRGDVISAMSSVSNDEQQFSQNAFCLHTSTGTFIAKQIVIATGGMAAPAIGATDFGLRIARQFGLKIIEPRPALVPLEFNGVEWTDYVALAGISLEARIANGEGKKAVSFDEDILFTHKGLSGPGILQISSYWDGKSPLYIDLCPRHDLETILLTEKQGNKQQLGTVLSQYLPKRLAQHMIARLGLAEDKRLAEYADKVLRQLAQSIKAWKITPKGTAGYKKAEAMRGGVDTAELDQKTMMSKKVLGLYFIGEVVDITGWLGGYNFQWAWSSAVACAEALRA